MKKDFLYLSASLVILVLILLGVKNVQQLRGKAAPVPANIQIDTRQVLGPVVNDWSSFSQGGEEPPPMLNNAKNKMVSLAPKFIRIDHIFDSYSVVQPSGNGVVFDFSSLDRTVDDILATGATPFFSLSYMPPVFTSTGSVIDQPANWENWKNLVRATIEHYSGTQARNLNGVYYEVWNEPELTQFGKWTLTEGKDYRNLYLYASEGAAGAQNVNKFYLGGPASGSFYPDWINSFLSFVEKNNLRLDFYSWHRYTTDPNRLAQDAFSIKKLLTAFPSHASIPIFLTEWGINSANTAINNTTVASAYTVSAVSKFYGLIDQSFTFEIKDGPPPNGGQWGLLTHESGNPPLAEKPRFKAFEALNQLSGNQISLKGGDGFISGLASETPEATTVLLSNYDPEGNNIENVPVTFSGLNSADYSLEYRYPTDNLSGKYDLAVTRGTLTKSFIMHPNSLLLLTLKPQSLLADYVTGASGQPGDEALLLNNISPSLSFNFPEFRLFPTGSIGFDLKPIQASGAPQSSLIMEAPFATETATIKKLFLSREVTDSGDNLVMGIAGTAEEFTVSAPGGNFTNNVWHHIQINWSPTNLTLTVDNIPVNRPTSGLDIRNGKILTFYPIQAAIDNLKVTAGSEGIISRSFDGRLDR